MAMPFIAGAILCIAGPAVGADEEDSTELFTEVGTSAGIDFVHFNGMSGELYFPEMVGSGAALFDYDNDGDLDIYLVQGNMLGRNKTLKDALIKPNDPALTDRLYRNDTVLEKDETRFKFTDVTSKTGIKATGYGMGVAAGDINNDGWVDLYVTNFGSNQLWLNSGDGTFEDVTEKAGADDNRWSVSAAFVDYDRDGDLDLYVGNYVNFSFDNHKPCRSSTSARDYCSPLVYQPVTDRLFENKGNVTFEDVSKSAGITRVTGGALGVITADFNSDGWLDIYVANDGVANQLWINQGDGRFVDDAVLGGVAVNMDGKAEASMGVDAADFDGDGDEDLFMTNLARETNTLYVNDGTGWFVDRTVVLGLANTSFAFTGFGTAWFDYDNDGWLDILTVNGAVTIIESQVLAGELLPLRQINQLFHNDGKGAYREVTRSAGSVFKLSDVSRGAAFGDIDNDGDTDVLITNNSGPARLLENRAGNKNSWIGFDLRDETARQSLGAHVAVRVNSNWRRLRSRSDGSYASSNDPRILFGLNGASSAVLVQVDWPDGSKEEWSDLAAGQYHELRRGSGRAPHDD